MQICIYENLHFIEFIDADLPNWMRIKFSPTAEFVKGLCIGNI